MSEETRLQNAEDQFRQHVGDLQESQAKTVGLFGRDTPPGEALIVGGEELLNDFLERHPELEQFRAGLAETPTARRAHSVSRYRWENEQRG